MRAVSDNILRTICFMIMKSPVLRFVLGLFLLAASCSPSKEPTKKPPQPYDTLTVGSLTLAQHARRIEKADVSQIADIITREHLHILAVVGMTRYPLVATRVDLVEELARLSGMYAGFGESATISGRQTGNAIFSVYPIKAQRTTQYEGLHSTSFESAYQATIDCGLRDVVAISTHLPEHLIGADRDRCLNVLFSLREQYANTALIVAGNLPALSNDAGDFLSVGVKGSNLLLWYSNDGTLNPISQKTVKTSLGTMAITRFEIFRPLVP